MILKHGLHLALTSGNVFFLVNGSELEYEHILSASYCSTSKEYRLVGNRALKDLHLYVSSLISLHVRLLSLLIFFNKLVSIIYLACHVMIRTKQKSERLFDVVNHSRKTLKKMLKQHCVCRDALLNTCTLFQRLSDVHNVRINLYQH